MQNLDFDTKHWCTMYGGMSNIIDACAHMIGSGNIRLNAAVWGIAEIENGKVELSVSGHGRRVHAFDKVLLAIPTGAISRIQQRPQWSFMKEQSFRGAWLQPLYKIGLHFRTRFWEHMTDPCFGGQSTMDRRFRWIVYPSDHLGNTGSGILLLYCWMSDALRWSSLSREERVQIYLHDLAKYFADNGDFDVYDQHMESFDVLWSNEYCGGDAMFLPGQFSRFHEVARKAEGNIHFAGEHLSRPHTWIAGALDSWLTAVRQMAGEEVQGLGTEHERPTEIAQLPRRKDFTAQASSVLPILPSFMVPFYT